MISSSAVMTAAQDVFGVEGEYNEILSLASFACTLTESRLREGADQSSSLIILLAAAELALMFYSKQDLESESVTRFTAGDVTQESDPEMKIRELTARKKEIEEKCSAFFKDDSFMFGAV